MCVFFLDVVVYDINATPERFAKTPPHYATKNDGFSEIVATPKNNAPFPAPRLISGPKLLRQTLIGLLSYSTGRLSGVAFNIGVGNSQQMIIRRSLRCHI